ncbi:MAG TPA: ABC transporter ATP-binding protein [Acidimicrobiia bacterium]
MPVVVRLRSAVCLLDRFPALAGVDLDVAEREILLVSGANGAGKTTLLRLIAGLVPLQSGTADVLGHDLATDRTGARRDLALVGHDTFCYDDLTVRENLRFAARAAQPPRTGPRSLKFFLSKRGPVPGGRTVGRPSTAGGTAGDAACDTACDAAMERLGLTRVAATTHARLSAGQRKRLALAVALTREPRLLLLDEPHAGLDARGREVLDAVVASAPSEGRTVVLVSHEVDRARTLATREVVLHAGRAVSVASPAPAAAAQTGSSSAARA